MLPFREIPFSHHKAAVYPWESWSKFLVIIVYVYIIIIVIVILTSLFPRLFMDRMAASLQHKINIQLSVTFTRLILISSLKAAVYPWEYWSNFFWLHALAEVTPLCMHNSILYIYLFIIRHLKIYYLSQKVVIKPMFCRAVPLTKMTRGPLQCTKYGPPTRPATQQFRYNQGKINHSKLYSHIYTKKFRYKNKLQMKTHFHVWKESTDVNLSTQERNAEKKDFRRELAICLNSSRERNRLISISRYKPKAFNL